MDSNVGTKVPPRKFNIVEFFGRTSHAEDYRCFPGAQPMSKLFRPFARPFEPWRLPFDSQTFYSTTYNQRTPYDRPYVGAWAQRDCDQVGWSSDPLDVTTIYTGSYQNPNVHVNRAGLPNNNIYSARPITAPQTSTNGIASPQENPGLSSSSSAQPIEVSNVRPSTTATPQRKHQSFAPYKAVAFNGHPNYASEYALSYRDYGGVRDYCQRHDSNSSSTCALPRLVKF